MEEIINKHLEGVAAAQQRCRRMEKKKRISRLIRGTPLSIFSSWEGAFPVEIPGAAVCRRERIDYKPGRTQDSGHPREARRLSLWYGLLAWNLYGGAQASAVRAALGADCPFFSGLRKGFPHPGDILLTQRAGQAQQGEIGKHGQGMARTTRATSEEKVGASSGLGFPSRKPGKATQKRGFVIQLQSLGAGRLPSSAGQAEREVKISLA